jgi:branched-chain amino acid transport system permease protein
VFDLIFQQVANGIMVGCVYALVAVGLTMIFGVLRAINFAHGEYFMIGTFAAWWVMERLDVPYVLSIPLALLIAAAIAIVVSRLVMQRLVGVPFQMAVLATVGVSLVLQNSVILGFGGTHKNFPGGWIDPVEVLGVSMAQQRLVVIGATLVVFAGLEWMVRHTRIGKAMRAVAQNTECCMIVGIDIERVARFTFVLGIVLAALSGVLTGPINVAIYGGMGEIVTLKTFAVIVMGGMGNVQGTLYSAWMLGIVESLVAGFVGMQYRDAVGFAALIAILMWRPWGLFSVQGRF